MIESRKIVVCDGQCGTEAPVRSTTPEHHYVPPDWATMDSERGLSASPMHFCPKCCRLIFDALRANVAALINARTNQ